MHADDEKDLGIPVEPAPDPIATPEHPVTLAEIRAALAPVDPSFLRDVMRLRNEERLAR